jgi:undecaprenyl-diphosphatase
MIESLESLDRQLVLFINGLHNGVLDEIMWFFSGPFILIPLFIMVFWSLYKLYSPKQMIISFLAILLVVALADLSSVYLFKEVFMRYRPSHHTELIGRLHFYELSDNQYYRGGLYGFVSSHAANYFGILTVCWTLSKHKWIKRSVLTITCIILLSRVYLGVHYVSDIICGAILGALIAKIILHFLILKHMSRA